MDERLGFAAAIKKWRDEINACESTVSSSHSCNKINSRNDVTIIGFIRPLLVNENEEILASAPIEAVHRALSYGPTYEYPICSTIPNRDSIYVHSEVDGLDSIQTDEYKLDKVISGNHQCIYDQIITQSTIDSIILTGLDVTVLAYGQTFSGKTHTCLELMLQGGLQLLTSLTDQQIPGILCMYIYELRGETCWDLIPNIPESVNIYENHTKHFITTSSCVEITSADLLNETVLRCMANRRSSATETNHSSSRSHAFCVYKIKYNSNETGEKFSGSLRIVDLAGSERYENAIHHSKELISELKQINYSLGCLKECIRAMATQNTATFVPFRRSKLTMLLRDSLVQLNSQIDDRTCCSQLIFLAHIHPLRSALKHTRNTLTYASGMCAHNLSQAETDRASFVGPMKWTAKQLSEWVSTLAGGTTAAVFQRPCGICITEDDSTLFIAGM